MTLIAQYLLVGLITIFLIEHAILLNNQKVSFGERIIMIGFWPIMIITFMYYFIKGLLDD